MAQEKPTKSKRFPKLGKATLRFAMQVFIAAAGFSLGYSGWTTAYDPEQRRAVHTIKRVGGTPNYRLSTTTPAWATKLRLAGFMDRYHRLVGADLSNADINDTELEKIAKRLAVLADFDGLNLSNATVTDEGIKHLEQLTKLRDVQLANTQVSDSAIEPLKQAIPELTVSR